MPRLLLIAAVLAGAYLYLNGANTRFLTRGFHASAPSGGSLNPVMGGMAGGVGAAAVGLAGRSGG